MTRRTTAFALAFAAVAPLAFAESLGEVARKEKERRRKNEAGAAVTVLTNDDLASTKGQLANDPAATPAGPDGSARLPGGPPSVAGPDYGLPTSMPRRPSNAAALVALEPYWRQEAQRRRAEVARLEKAAQRADRRQDPTYAGTDAPT